MSPNDPIQPNPPDPPGNNPMDIESTNQDPKNNNKISVGKSFCSVLCTPYPNSNPNNLTSTSQIENMILDQSEGLKEPIEAETINVLDQNSINLIREEMSRLYQPWAYSLIIKLLGRKIPHMYLNSRLTALWRTSEDILLIDLGHDYFTVKFLKTCNRFYTEVHGS